MVTKRWNELQTTKFPTPESNQQQVHPPPHPPPPPSKKKQQHRNPTIFFPVLTFRVFPFFLNAYDVSLTKTSGCVLCFTTFSAELDGLFSCGLTITSRWVWQWDAWILLQWSCWLVVTTSTPMVVQRLQRIRPGWPGWSGWPSCGYGVVGSRCFFFAEQFGESFFFGKKRCFLQRRDKYG